MNKDSFAAFLLKLFALTVILFGISFYVFNKLIVLPMPCGIILGVLFIVTALSHYIVMKAAAKSGQVFTRTYMSLSSGRLMLYSIFIFAYCFTHRDIAKEFVLTFFVYYIFYTIFDVRAVRVFLRKK